VARRDDPTGSPREYLAGKLTRETLEADPLDQFRTWLVDAAETDLPDPNAMALATVDAAMRPSMRMVLLKAFDERGFLFTTNYDSRKGTELDANPNASLLFYWPPLERQVRIDGAVERTSPEESDRIFQGRPRGARLGAWASRQSRTIPDRQSLERRLREVDKRYPEEIPRPGYWGGFRLLPERFEFWQGRVHRLHDRFRFERSDAGAWSVERLSP
jgi:pyridoxamine 5'-phosphate oxidase